jgi:dethiobiotin synthetase/adenosylmethionine--8-amino-7-oxononanoate aminotransferase
LRILVDGQESVTANRGRLIAAAAAGRYGHVIFPDVVHAPAVALSQSWYLMGPMVADRVFSPMTGRLVEVAVKMGIKTYQKTYG